ncbi:MAG: M55 family metallopeptidase [Candidatus Neomarinimicrobiota bacterium]|jgi:D-amino peptidase
MRLFISADIEGVTGINSWSETTKTNPDYAEFREQMTKEVLAACEGALAAGATEIVVKDAHDSGRNLRIGDLPKEVKLIRNWSRHPYSMVWGIDESFDAIAYIAYHSPSGSKENPLAHTMSSKMIHQMTLNGEICSEFMLHSLVARSHGVPSVFLSGDEGICKLSTKMEAKIVTVPTISGTGNATLSNNPKMTIPAIKAGLEKALKKDLKSFSLEVPDHFILDTRYTKHPLAFRAAQYPGAKPIDAYTTRFEADTILDIMRFIMFCV